MIYYIGLHHVLDKSDLFIDDDYVVMLFLWYVRHLRFIDLATCCVV